MSDLLQQETEGRKRTEYMELFFYVILAGVFIFGNNPIRILNEEGMVTQYYLDYLLAMLEILEIWYITTVYFNRFGSNGIAERIMILINGFLLILMAKEWIWLNYDHYPTTILFLIAWALILIHMGIQFLIKAITFQMDVSEIRYSRRWGILLLLQGMAVIAVEVVHYDHEYRIIGGCSLLIWFITVLILESRSSGSAIDPEAMSDRLARFVVLSFGMAAIESILILAKREYDLYYLVMVFLCIAGLLGNYDYYCRRLLDRQQIGKGLGYMLLHMFLLIGLAGFSTAFIQLTFYFRGYEAYIIQTASVLLFFAMFFALSRYSFRGMMSAKSLIIVLVLCAVYIGLMIFCRYSYNLLILVTAGFIGLVFVYTAGVRIKLEFVKN